MNENLIQENLKLRNELSEIKSSHKTMQEQINFLESDLHALKSSKTDKPAEKSLLSCNEDTILEIQQRIERQKNIVIAGICELQNNNLEQRQSYDRNEVVKLTKSIFSECPDPIKVFRLGKHKPGKNRLLKVCFATAETAKYLLQNQPKNYCNIRLYSDQTPAQRNYMNHLKEELDRREKSGELDLTIKYIKNVPKIVKKLPKNGDQF